MTYPGQGQGNPYQIFDAQERDPNPLEFTGKAYVKRVSGVTQFFFQCDDGTVHQLTPTGVGVKNHDFVYDANATPSGNVYADWASLYAAASSVNGPKRVYVQSEFLEIDAAYTLDDSWSFIGVKTSANLIPSLDFVPGGAFVVEDGLLNLENMTFRAGVDPGESCILFGIAATISKCSLFLKAVTFEASTVCNVFDSVDTAIVTVVVYGYDVFDSWNPGGQGFVFADLQGDIYLRNCSINSPYFFGSAQNSLNVSVDNCRLPNFPTGAADGGGSPFDAGLNEANYFFSQTFKHIQASIQFTGDLDDLELYAGDLVDILVMLPLDGTGRLVTLSDVNEKRAFDVLNGSSFPITIVHDDNPGGGNSILCPGGLSFVLPPNGGFRMVRDSDADVWRVLVPSASTAYYDLVYDSGAGANTANVFSDFASLHAVGSQLSGMKRVWLKTNLDIDADYICNGGWTFEGLGGNGGIYGLRDLTLNGDVIVESDVLKFNNVIVIGQTGSIKPDGTSGTCLVSFTRSTCNGDGTPVVVPLAGQCSIELDQSNAYGSPAVGAFQSIDGWAVVRDTELSTCAFVDTVNLSFYFMSGSLPLDNVANNVVPNWTDFDTNAQIYGNTGWCTRWDLTGNPTKIAVNAVEVVKTIWLTTPVATPQTLHSIQAPGSVQASFDIVNSGPEAVTLPHQSGSGAVNGLFACPGGVDKVLQPFESCRCVYDRVNLEWSITSYPSNYTAIELVPVFITSGSASTLAATDFPENENTDLFINSGINYTFTLPADADADIPIGRSIPVTRYHAQTLTFAAGAGATVRTPSSLTARAQNSTVLVRKIAANTYLLSGDLT